MIVTNYETLAIAILQQAANDYRMALKKKNKKRITYFEEWFMDDWAQLLSHGMGEIIIQKCREQTIDKKRRMVVSIM